MVLGLEQCTEVLEKVDKTVATHKKALVQRAECHHARWSRSHVVCNASHKAFPSRGRKDTKRPHNRKSFLATAALSRSMAFDTLLASTNVVVATVCSLSFSA